MAATAAGAGGLGGGGGGREGGLGGHCLWSWPRWRQRQRQGELGTAAGCEAAPNAVATASSSLHMMVAMPLLQENRWHAANVWWIASAYARGNLGRRRALPQPQSVDAILSACEANLGI